MPMHHAFLGLLARAARGRWTDAPEPVGISGEAGPVAEPAAQPAPAGGPTVVRMETTKGDVVMELHDEDAPNTVQNFVDLVNKQFYDGLTFHRYVAGFVIQGGDPDGTGGGGPGHTIKLEIGKEKHLKGTLGMARTPDPDSAGSQFYICLADTPSLDGQYATFGHVTQSMDVVEQLRKGDAMTRVWVDGKPAGA